MSRFSFHAREFILYGQRLHVDCHDNAIFRSRLQVNTFISNLLAPLSSKMLETMVLQSKLTQPNKRGPALHLRGSVLGICRCSCTCSLIEDSSKIEPLPQLASCMDTANRGSGLCNTTRTSSGRLLSYPSLAMRAATFLTSYRSTLAIGRSSRGRPVTFNHSARQHGSWRMANLQVTRRRQYVWAKEAWRVL